MPSSNARHNSYVQICSHLPSGSGGNGRSHLRRVGRKTTRIWSMWQAGYTPQGSGGGWPPGGALMKSLRSRILILPLHRQKCESQLIFPLSPLLCKLFSVLRSNCTKNRYNSIGLCSRRPQSAQRRHQILKEAKYLWLRDAGRNAASSHSHGLSDSINTTFPAIPNSCM